jgi:hypothetical protein
MRASRTEAIAILIAMKVNGGAYGIPYRIPVNPVLHRSTKIAGAVRVVINPRIGF